MRWGPGVHWITAIWRRRFGARPGQVTSCISVPLDLNSREQETCQPVHVINVDIQDNHEEATLGAFLICELCQCVSVRPLACSGCAGTWDGRRCSGSRPRSCS